MNIVEAWAWTIGMVAVILVIPTRSLILGVLAVVALPVALALLLLV